MAENQNEDQDEAVTEGPEVEKTKKSFFAKWPIFVVLALLIFSGGGFLGWKMTHLGKTGASNQASKKGEEDKIEKEEEGGEIAFLNLPEILFNLKATKGKGTILKATFVLELRRLSDKEKVDHLKPLIIDQMQSYLRELEVVDIQGAAGLERIRQELLNRINISIAPIKIRQVLIKDFIFQ